jgi:hypothetical protein
MLWFGRQDDRRPPVSNVLRDDEASTMRALVGFIRLGGDVIVSE